MEKTEINAEASSWSGGCAGIGPQKLLDSLGLISKHAGHTVTHAGSLFFGNVCGVPGLSII